MEVECGKDQSSLLSAEELLTPKTEIDDYESFFSPGEEEKHGESSVVSDSCGIVSHVILGQPVVNSDPKVFKVYICSHEAYEAMKRSVAECFVMKSGMATCHVCAGRRCRFVVELHAQTNITLGNGRNIMWCAVDKFNANHFNEVARDQLGYLLQPVWFQCGVGTNCFNDAESPLHHQEHTCIDVIASNEIELASMFPGKGPQSLCTPTTISNALKVSSYIKIRSSMMCEKEKLTNVLANALYNFYQAEAREASAAATVFPCNYSASEEYGVSELQGNALVDTYGLHDVKDNIKEESVCETTNADPACVLQTKDNYKFDGSFSEEEDFPATAKPCIYPGRRLLLECPMCSSTFRSSRNRYKSLVNHIKRRHKGCQKHLLRVAKKKYAGDASTVLL